MRFKMSFKCWLPIFLFLAAFSLTGAGQAQAADPIVGRWDWCSGAVHFFGPAGLIDHNPKYTWKRVVDKNRYIITWGRRIVDTVHLANDGKELRGKNTNGEPVWGKRKKD